VALLKYHSLLFNQTTSVLIIQLIYFLPLSTAKMPTKPNAEFGIATAINKEKSSKPTRFLLGLATRQKIREINSEKTWTLVESYEEACAALIATENSQAFDSQAVAAASAIEKRANELVSTIRKEDEEEI
jgi:hypothetical protein